MIQWFWDQRIWCLWWDQQHLPEKPTLVFPNKALIIDWTMFSCTLYWRKKVAKKGKTLCDWWFYCFVKVTDWISKRNKSWDKLLHGKQDDKERSFCRRSEFFYYKNYEEKLTSVSLAKHLHCPWIFCVICLMLIKALIKTKDRYNTNKRQTQ